MKIEITEQDIKNGFREPVSEKTIQQEQKTNRKHFRQKGS
jgi:hypothetical protein